MLRTVVLFFVVCALGALILLAKKAVNTRKKGRDSEPVLDEQNLHTRYSFGEFSHEEYQGQLIQLRSRSAVQ